jgi:protein-S-isoprenylcysteine O-methyltransferase Ste14
LVYLGALAVGFALEAVLPGTAVPAAVRWPLGALLGAAGVALSAGHLRAFRRAETAVRPYRPTRAIVTSGPYRLTRNPGYLGMTLASGAIALLAGALWPFLPLAAAVAVIDRGVIAREERYLAGKFGDEYHAYCARVRRWL